MNARPLVSAIVATYNRSYIVCEAVDSILSQTYPNIEVLVLDDGSTDDTRRTLARYGNRIRVVYQENAGPAAAWNAGLRRSRGEIVAFLGSDDLWLPAFVERQVSVLVRAGEDVPCCLANSWLSFADGRNTTSFQHAHLNPPYNEGLWLNVPDILATRFVLFGQTVAVRRAVLDQVGVFDEGFRLLEDYDLALRLAIQGPWGFIREPLVVWRQGTTDSLSQEGMRDLIQVKENIIKSRRRVAQVLSVDDRLPRCRSLLRRELRHDQLELWAETTRQKGAPRTYLGGAARFLLKCDNYLYRRSPSYPTMVTARLADSATSTGRASART